MCSRCSKTSAMWEHGAPRTRSSASFSEWVPVRPSPAPTMRIAPPRLAAGPLLTRPMSFLSRQPPLGGSDAGRDRAVEVLDSPAALHRRGDEAGSNRRALLGRLGGDDGLAERGERKQVGLVVEGDDVLPVPPQGLRLGRDFG